MPLVQIFRSNTTWFLVVPAILLILSNVSIASTGTGDVRTTTYVGVFAGSALTENRLIDVDGFANWGNPGWVSYYEDSGFISGALIGNKFDINEVPLRIEIDISPGNISAETNKLDPFGLDETARSDYEWIITVRAGIEKTIGRATIFATGGIAGSRLVNSVTDIDFGPTIPTHVDNDDSFQDKLVEHGWVLGVGVETAIADAWMLRLEASYIDFGLRTYFVNLSGNNSCGRGNPRRPCPYKVENKLGTVRLMFIHRFGQ